MRLRQKPPVSFVLFLLFFAISSTANLIAQVSTGNKALHQFFDDYYEESLKLFPINATYEGDTRYNDLLPNDGSISFLKEKHNFHTKYQQGLKKFDYQTLNEQDKVSYDILMDITRRELGMEQFHPEYMPVTQVFSLPLTMAQLGAGTGAQPFKTVKDYDNWLKRTAQFAVWTDTAIANFRKGAKAGYVLPKAIVVKLIPQMESLAQRDSSKSIFYGPIRNFPKDFSAAEKARLATAYYTSINQHYFLPIKS